MKIKKLLAHFILPVLPLLLLVFASTIPALAAVGITDIQPRTVAADSSVNLVVTGTDFADGAVVVLSNYGALATGFVSPTNLTAQLPAGIAPGTYSITVLNPDSSSATLPNALTVEQTVPTSLPPQEATTATPYVRPLVVVSTYSAGTDAVTPGQDFDLIVKVQNMGGREAVNFIASFTPGDCIPRESGGVLAKVELQPGESKKLDQPMTATRELFGKSIASIVMQLSYTDLNGTAYTGTFNLTLPVKGGSGAPRATATPTPTGTATPRPQFVITSYTTDVDALKPGTRFSLSLQASNVGNGIAKRTTMIMGGGSSSSGGTTGTPDPGGVSGASGEFGNFAPVAASNVQYLGDVEAGSSLSAQAALIVNSKTEPGAYPMKISFTYTAENGMIYTDDQVVTLLVLSPPSVDVNFYQDPGTIFAGQPNRLPLQVVNLGRKATVLGTMKVSGEGAEFSQNSILVGALDTGGYYTMDASVIPSQPGLLNLVVTIDYTDDFNVPQVITKTIPVEVQEMVMPESVTPEPGTVKPGMEGDGGNSASGTETFLQKAWRFVRGLIGLDSGQAQPGSVPPGSVPSEGPSEQPVPVSPRGGKG